MGAMDLAAVMDELGDRVAAIPGLEPDTFLVGNVYRWPVSTFTVPAFVVGWPTQIDYDASMVRGNDRAQFPCWMAVGNGDPQSARDVLAAFLLGLKTALDGASEAWDSARAMNVTIQTASDEDGTEFLAARFTVDVVT